MKYELSDVIASAIVTAAAVVTCLKKYKFGKHNIENHLAANEKDIAINSLITDLSYEFKCSNVLVLQFHNGVNYFSGRGILKMVASHERVGRNGSTLSHDASGILCSPYSDLLNDLLTSGQCVQDRQEQKWRMLMPSRIVYSVNVACVNKNKMLGYVKLCWREKPIGLDERHLILSVRNKGIVEFIK